MDREKVIKGLKEIVNFFDIMSAIEGRCNELKQDAENAIDFLKEQEAKPPKITENAYGVKFYFCPRCSRPIIKSSAIGKPRHCEDCGQAVKIWEE